MVEVEDRFNEEVKNLHEYIALATVDAKHYQERALKVAIKESKR